MKRSCLPRNGEPILFPVSFTPQAMGPAITVDQVPTPALDALSKIADGFRQSSRAQKIAGEISQMKELEILDVALLVKALLKASDGDTRGTLQGCLEEIEENIPKDDVEEQYALLCHPNSLP